MIADVRAKIPVGAVLTIGTKGPRGTPIDRDRFYLKVPEAASEAGQGMQRALHPSFVPYNAAQPERRKAMRGVFVHGTEDQCFESSRKAQKITTPGFRNHPKLPACVSTDGKTAQRLVMLSDDSPSFAEISCPGHLCQFAQSKICKPWMRLLFQPVWKADNLPTPLFKFTSQSWNTAAACVGMFDYIREQARLLGVEKPNLYGLSFEMLLGSKTDPTKQTSFPVVTFSVTAHLQEFLLSQREREQKLREAPNFIALPDAEEQEPETVLADKLGIEPTPQPRETA